MRQDDDRDAVVGGGLALAGDRAPEVFHRDSS